MYNGIGLQTARGSGTNGYVQRNLSFVKQTKKPIEYKSEDDFKRLEKELNRVPNKEILEHQNKRQIELKCLQMEDQMEQQGFTAQEIEAKVKEFRETLKHKMESSVSKKTEWLLQHFPQNVKETHQMAEVNHQKNDLLKTVLKIGPNFIEGSSLDPTRKAREAAAKQEQLQKKYHLIRDPSPEKEIKSYKIDTKEDKHKNIKKSESHKRKSSKHSSDSDSDSDSVKSDSSDESSRKRKKNKTKDKRTKDSKRQKSKDRKSRKHKKYSDSSSGSDSDSDSDSSSDTESNDSSDDSHYKSRNGRKNDRSKRERQKRSPSPETERNRSKSYAELKESTQDFNDNIKTSHSIAMNIRQMRKEAQNFVALDKQHNPINDTQKPKDTKRDYKELSPKPRESPRRRYSRSSSHSSERDSRVKRMKSAVYETSAAKKIREVPKSYDDKRYESRKERSLSPKNRSRHSSGSQRSRSRSVHSYDSKSSNRSSRSRSSSSSKSSTKSSKSSSRSESRSRSPSIPRRKGSPSFLDKRRITSARKRPIPYRRGSPNSSLRSSRSSRSQSGCSSRSLSVSSSDSFNSNTYKLI